MQILRGEMARVLRSETRGRLCDLLAQGTGEVGEDTRGAVEEVKMAQEEDRGVIDLLKGKI